MKRFRYSLETLLSLRREREQECEIELANASSELMSVENRIESARIAGDRAFLITCANMNDMVARENLWLKSHNDQKALEKPRAEAAKKIENARVHYHDAHSRRVALDRIREKRLRQWRKKVKKEEINRLDETNNAASMRQRLWGR